MKVAIMGGTGYVGVITGLGFAELGNQVVGVDVNWGRVSRLNEGSSPIYEPGLEQILRRNLEAGRIWFTTDSVEGVRDAKVIFIAVGTPAQSDGHADLAQVISVSEGNRKIVRSQAGVVTVETTALTNEDVSDVEISIKVSFEWILGVGLDNVRIAHINSEGDVELLIPECTFGPEVICVAKSDQGFSEFSLLALANEPANFVAENLVVEPKAVGPGESVQITVDIFNEGAEGGVFSSILTLKRPGQDVFDPIAVKEITLLAGGSGRVTFFVESQEQGQYSVEIEGRRGEFLTGTFEVSRALDPANLSLSDLVIAPAQVEPFNPVTIRLVASNRGELDGRTELEFRINGVLTELRSVVVPGGSSIDVEFGFEPPAEGVFIVEIIDPEEIVEPVRGEITAAVPIPPALLLFEVGPITPLQARPGEEVTVVFEITNFGGLPGTANSVLLLDTIEVARQENIEIDELASEPIVFTITAPQDPGEYTLVLEATDQDGIPTTLEWTFNVITIVEKLRISRLDLSATQVLFGDDITVSVVIENSFGQPLTETFSLILDGEVLEEREVTVSAGQTVTETFEIRSPAAGSHRVEIEGVPVQTFDVRVTEAEPALLKLVAPIEVSPREVDAGDTVTVRVTIANEGEEPGATTVIFQVNGVEVDRKSSGTIRGGEDVTVEFQVARDEGGDYTILVQALEAEEGFDIGEDSFTVLALPEAKLEVQRPVTVTPGTVISGQPVTISALVTNEGNIEGSVPVRLIIDGELIDTRDVTLGAGDSTTVEFADIVEPDVGTHRVEVNGVSAQFTVTAPAAAGGFPIIILIVVVVVVLAAAGGGAFFFLKKKNA